MKKINVNVEKYFEVFDRRNDNELKATYSNAQSAIDMAKNNDGYAVDLVIDLSGDAGESCILSGDNLFTMQIFPSINDYNNHDEVITIIGGKAE